MHNWRFTQNRLNTFLKSVYKKNTIRVRDNRWWSYKSHRSWEMGSNK